MASTNKKSTAAAAATDEHVSADSLKLAQDVAGMKADMAGMKAELKAAMKADMAEMKADLQAGLAVSLQEFLKALNRPDKARQIEEPKVIMEVEPVIEPKKKDQEATLVKPDQPRAADWGAANVWDGTFDTWMAWSFRVRQYARKFQDNQKGLIEFILMSSMNSVAGRRMEAVFEEARASGKAANASNDVSRFMQAARASMQTVELQAKWGNLTRPKDKPLEEHVRFAWELLSALRALSGANEEYLLAELYDKIVPQLTQSAGVIMMAKRRKGVYGMTLEEFIVEAVNAEAMDQSKRHPTSSAAAVEEDRIMRGVQNTLSTLATSVKEMAAAVREEGKLTREAIVAKKEAESKQQPTAPVSTVSSQAANAKCFNCQGFGHRMAQCPTPRNRVLAAHEEYVVDQDQGEEVARM